VKWTVILSRAAVKDIQKLKAASLQPQARRLLDLLHNDPFTNYPAYEKLVGNLRGYYARRINIQHRLVYAVDEPSRTVHMLRMWSHHD
jgi:Txe/YoeB family toxin of toxin-antitoxin system